MRTAYYSMKFGEWMNMRGVGTIMKIWAALLLMLVVSGLSFCVFNFLGDPVNNILGVNATLEQREGKWVIVTSNGKIYQTN